jgi:Peptidase M50B-like
MDKPGRRIYTPRMGVTQAPLSGLAAALIGLASLAVLMLGAGWRVIRHFTTMAHEAAHAVFGGLLMRSFYGIELKPNSDGVTDIRPTNGLGGVVIGFAGYLGPSLFGLGAAKLIEARHITAVLWSLLFLLGILLLNLRWSYGIYTVIVAGGLVYLVLRYTPAAVQIVAAYAVAWLLLLSGVVRILERNIGSSDAKRLAGTTGLPRFLWFLLWLAGSLIAVAVGGKWLILGT